MRPIRYIENRWLHLCLVTTYNNDDDLHDFVITPKKAIQLCNARINKRPKQLLTSNLPSFNTSNNIEPIHSSTQILNSPIVNTLVPPQNNSNHTTPLKIIQCLPEPTQNQTHLLDPSTTITNKHISITLENIPLPTQPAPHTNDSKTTIIDHNVPENISFFTSYYIQEPHNFIINHYRCTSPPQSPTPTAPLVHHSLQNFNLQRIELCNSDSYDTYIICRKCCVAIDFKKLLLIPHHLPKGKQTFCAECLLMMLSRQKDSSVDYFKTTWA